MNEEKSKKKDCSKSFLCGGRLQNALINRTFWTASIFLLFALCGVIVDECYEAFFICGVIVGGVNSGALEVV